MDTKPSSYRIMVFSWNTESVSLGETLDPNIAAFNRESCSAYIPGLTTWKYPGIIPDFYPKLAAFIVHHDPDIIVIGFQEDRYPGSYFHSHLLPEEMPKIGYGLIKRTKLMGIGVTSYNGTLNGDPFERGIRVSIYVKKDLIQLIEREETEMRHMIGNDGQSEYICSSFITRGKGATTSYLMLPGFGRLAFICCHLPFNASSLINERIHKNKMLRQNELNQSNTCFNNIIENLVLFKEPMPTHVIYFGDFNYRLGDMRPASTVADEFYENRDNKEFIRNIYVDHDELLEQMRRKNIYMFSEGVDGDGMSFIPTCKMIKNRPSLNDEDVKGTDIWKTGKFDQRIPSWCDRILYHKFTEDGHNLLCTYYDRFDFGEIMSESDHAGVIGLFVLA